MWMKQIHRMKNFNTKSTMASLYKNFVFLLLSKMKLSGFEFVFRVEPLMSRRHCFPTSH